MNIDKFLADGQDPKVVEKIYVKIADMLTHNESISYIALQKKPAVTLLPDSIAISNKRIFLCEFTKLGLSTNFEIFPWKEIKDIAFKEEIFGSKVTVIPFTGENLSIDYIPKVQARKLYQLIKDALEYVNTAELEETSPIAPVVIETRTEVKAPSINDLYKQQAEQKREQETTSITKDTKTWSTPLPQTEVEKEIQPVIPKVAPTYTQPADHTPKSSSIEEDVEDEITTKLKKLKSLYDKQLITQAEYESKKAEILSQL